MAYNAIKKVLVYEFKYYEEGTPHAVLQWGI